MVACIALKKRKLGKDGINLAAWSGDMLFARVDLGPHLGSGTRLVPSPARHGIAGSSFIARHDWEIFDGNPPFAFVFGPVAAQLCTHFTFIMQPS